MSKKIYLGDGHLNPSDLDQIVNCIENNGLVIIPTDTVYGLIGKAFDDRTFNKLDAAKQQRAFPYVAVFESVKAVQEWYGFIDYYRQRIMHSLLPGPVTIVLPQNDSIPGSFRYDDTGIGIRVSSNSILPAICRKLQKPIWATSANRGGEPAPTSFEEISRELLEEVDIVVSAGETSLKLSSTVVNLRSRPFKIDRLGPWMKLVEKTLLRSTKPLEIITLCTGNICRSPIAALLLSNMINPELRRYINFRSYGTGAIPGAPASVPMVEIANEWGMDLTTHRSQPVSSSITQDADLILAMTPKQKDFIVHMDRNAEHKVKLYSEPLGLMEIPDPYLDGRMVYMEVADMIRDAAELWVIEIERNIKAGAELQSDKLSSAGK